MGQALASPEVSLFIEYLLCARHIVLGLKSQTAAWSCLQGAHSLAGERERTSRQVKDVRVEGRHRK